MPRPDWFDKKVVQQVARWVTVDIELFPGREYPGCVEREEQEDGHKPKPVDIIPSIRFC